MPRDSPWNLAGQFLDDASLEKFWRLPGLAFIVYFLRAERTTKRIHEMIKRFMPSEIATPYNLLQASDDENEHLFEWGAKRAEFYSLDHFERFCRLAGVISTKIMPVKGMFHWVSQDKKVM